MHIAPTLLIKATYVSADTPLALASKGLQIEYAPRAPDQMSSIYEAGGFPRLMIEAIGGRDWYKPEYIEFLRSLPNTARPSD